MARSLSLALAVVSLTGWSLWLAPSRAAAQSDEEHLRLAPRAYVQGQLGLFGDVRLQSEDVEGTDALDPSGGAVIGFEVPLANVFSLGAELGGWGWNSQRGDHYDIGPSFLGDLSIVPRVRVPWASASGSHGAVGLAVPVGPTLSVLNEDIQDGLEAFGASANTGAGLNVGALLNVQIFFIPSFGLTFDAGYQHHFLWHQVTGPLGGSHEVRFDMGQLVVRGGVIVAF
ncbi:MAG: hypothetical protein U0234_02520 [Sandaracinus sp.]